MGKPWDGSSSKRQTNLVSISGVQHAFLTHTLSTLLSLRPIPSDEKGNATRPLQYCSLCACVFFTKAPTKPHFKVNLETISFTCKSMCHDDMSMKYIYLQCIYSITYNQFTSDLQHLPASSAQFSSTALAFRFTSKATTGFVCDNCTLHWRQASLSSFTSLPGRNSAANWSRNLKEKYHPSGKCRER